MITLNKMNLLPTAVLAAALIATVAIARTVHTHGTMDGAEPPHASAMRAAPADTARAPAHGSIACGTLSYAACRQLEQMLPM